jgi:hypothetical protein
MNQKRKLVPQKIGTLDKRRRPRGLTRAIRTAIDSIIFDRRNRADACEKAGITQRALYLALEKMEVAAYWQRQTDVLRTGERARNIHRLVEIRDAANNMPAVNSIKTMMQIEDDSRTAHTYGGQVVPGMTINIITPPNAMPKPIDITIDHERSDDDAVEPTR